MRSSAVSSPRRDCERRNHVASKNRVWLSLRESWADNSKPARLFVMMGMAAFVVCGVTSFYTHRASHGRTAEERAGYAIGKKAGEEAAAEATLPTAAELNMMAQKFFSRQGSGNKENLDLAFENGYLEGFKRRIGHRERLLCEAVNH